MTDNDKTYSPESEVSSYKDPKAGKSVLIGDRNDWSNALGRRSIELAYAVIAGNWAISTGDSEGILANCYSRWSMILAVSFLGLNLIFMWAMYYLLRERIEEANQDENAWERAWKERASTKWPYTEKMEKFGKFYHLFKFVLPLAAGVFFVIRVFQGN